MRLLLVCAPLCLVTVGCSGGKDEDDADGDGHSSSLDCDDNDPAIFPGAPEVCDGVDNNCAGGIDEGVAMSFFGDADGDGFGNPLDIQQSCVPPAGYVTNPDPDCDDSDASVNPGAQELCDDIDHNCDGDPSYGAVDLVTWFIDSDNDGYGNPDIPLVECAQPSGYVEDNSDCQDTNASVNPGAEEVCNGVDDNCSGTVDDAAGAPTWHADNDGDGYGDASDPGVAVCDGPLGTVDNADDCDDLSAAVHPDADEICNKGIDDDCDPATDEDLVDGADWFTDGDLDGYGDDVSAVSACVAPYGLVAVGGDCNDGDGAVNPGASEVCGGVDEDCDTLLDVGAVDAPDWFEDLDGDTFGGQMLTTECSPPDPYAVAVGGDCDDGVATTYPGAPELCNNRIDDDCDSGTTDDDGPNTLTWYDDADRDGFGDINSIVLACLQPAFTTDLSGATDCDDAVGTTYPGAPELCNAGVDDDCDSSTDEEDGTTWYIDADDDGYGVGTNTITQCDPPVGYAALSGDCDDANDLSNPGLYPGCSWDHCGGIQTDQTWFASLAHHVSCDVRVAGGAGPVLTLEDGITITFDAGTGLTIGTTDDGSLVADGSGLGITMTPVGAATPGAWDGVTIGGRDQGSSLVGLTIEYAGSSGVAALYLTDSSPVVEDVFIDRSSVDGIFVDGGFPDISGTTVRNSGDDGIEIAQGGGLASAGSPTFTGNTLTGNAARPLSMPAAYVRELDTSSSFAGNGTDLIDLLAGVVAESVTWPLLDADYRISGSVVVEGPLDPTLTLVDGTLLLMGPGASIVVGVGSDGALDVQGSISRVVMTSDAASPSEGDWDGLTIGGNDLGSVIDGLAVSYGGGNGRGNIVVEGGAPVFTDLTSTLSSSDGLHARGASAAQITDSVFQNNLGDGVFVGTDATLGAAFANNDCRFNGGSGVRVAADAVGMLDPTSTYDSNVEIVVVSGDTVETSQTWPLLDERYRVTGTVFVEGPSSPALTIAGGTKWFFDDDVGLLAGVVGSGSVIVDGGLSRVTMTSSNVAPTAGIWRGVEVHGGNVSSRFEGLDILYAGDTNAGRGGNLELLDAGAVDVIDVASSDGSKSGVYGDGSTDLTITDSILARNAEYGAQVQSGGRVVAFSNNTTTANGLGSVGVLADSVGALDATNGLGGDVVINGGAVVADVTWLDLGVPMRITSNITVGASGSPHLTIDAGVVLTMDDVFIDVAGADPGSVSMGSVSGAPVVITSSQAAPAQGDWQGILLGPNCDAPSVVLENVDISYGGGGIAGMVVFDQCDGALTDSTVCNSASAGVLGVSASPILTNNTYCNNVGLDVDLQ